MTGWRTEQLYGEGYTDAASVMAHEIFELQNTDILDTLSETIFKDTEFGKKLEYLSSVLSCEVEDDEKLLELMSKLLNKDEVKLIRYIEDELKAMEGSVFNLYITKDYKLVGFDYVVDGFRDVYVYNLNGTYDVSIKFDKYIKYLLNSIGVEISGVNNIGLEINDDKEINVSTDSVDKFNLVIKQFDKSVISFEYKNASRTKGMEVVIKNDNVVIEYKNDDGKYFDMDIKLSKTEYIDMFSGDVVTSGKKINEARNEFYSGMSNDQKNTYNLIENVIYGER